MMNESNIYDVTFSDNITLKCYILINNDDGMVVRCDTLMGMESLGVGEGDDLEINAENKTAIANFSSTQLTEPDLTYNYFQNSNLSAWKVWYCLDNDTDRFAWAANIVVASASGNGDQTQITNQPMIAIESTDNSIMTYVRTPYLDNQNGCAWCYNGDTDNFSDNSQSSTFDNEDVLYTPTENPIIGSTITQDAGGETYSYKVIALSVGTGVIYRLIDEWSNDVPYDFKNIQYVRPLTDGEYDPDNGTDTWVYTFSYWYNDGVIDSSTEGQTFTDDGGDIAHICENTIKARNLGGKYNLSNNVIYSAPDGEWYYGAKYINIDGNSNINTILSDSSISLNYTNQTIIESNGILLHECYATSFSGYATIYIDNKKVLTEE